MENKNKKESISKSKKVFLTFILFVFLWILVWVVMSDPLGGAKVWDSVSINYTAYLEDWSVLEIRNESDPLTFQLWDRSVVDWINNAVVGMKLNKKKKVKISPEEWFGKYYDSSKHKNVPYSMLESFGIEPNTWDFVKLWDVKWVVKEILWTWEQDFVVLDTNDMKTWQSLTYEVELVGLVKKSE